MEKKHSNPIWSLALMCVLFSSPAVAQQKLSLPEAIARTLEKNPDLAIDAPGQSAARSEFAATRAGYLPRVDFEQSYLAGDNPVFVFGTLLAQRKFSAANFALPSLNNPDSVDNLQTRGTLQQNIWDFGRTANRRELARLGVNLADQSHQENRRQILLALFESYYATSLAADALQTAHVALRSAESLESQAKARVDSGLAVEADLLRSRVYLSSAKQQEIRAQGQLETARAQLNRLMGTDLTAPIGETAPLTIKPISLPSEDVLLSQQKKKRPDYQNLLSELRQAELTVGAHSKEKLPTLSGYTTWEMNNPSMSEFGGSNWAAGITLRWNLFAGGSDAAQLEAARQRLEQKRRQIAAMDSAMALDLRRALIQYRAAEQQVLAAQAAEAQSEEGLRILQNRYDAGLATMTDLLSAETARSVARTGLAEAIYRQRVGYAHVEYAAGILGPSSPAMSLQ
jgi:outer membrane protein TolC